MTSPSTFRARPLEGIRVVEVGVWHAGPGATAILGDLGASVVKIESLDGDPERYGAGSAVLRSQDIDTDDWSLMYEWSNRNKRGIAADISTPAGKAVLDRIVGQADVFLSNLRPSSKRKLGIDYNTLAAANPRLVYVNVTGFGPAGPRADEGAFDTLGQALAGMFHVTGHDVPQPLPVAFLDQLTAQAAAQGAVTALLARELHGEGQEVHVSLYGSGALLLSAQLMGQTVLGTKPTVTYDRLQKSPLMAVYRCADDRWIVGTNPGRSKWVPFCDAVGAHELADSEWDVSDRESQKRLFARLDPLFMERSADEWLAELLGRGLMYAPVQDFEQVLTDPQALANGYVVPREHPRFGSVTLPGSPFVFGKQEASRWEPAPGLGEHTDQILAEAGYDAAAISELRREGVVR